MDGIVVVEGKWWTDDEEALVQQEEESSKGCCFSDVLSFSGDDNFPFLLGDCVW